MSYCRWLILRWRLTPSSHVGRARVQHPGHSRPARGSTLRSAAKADFLIYSVVPRETLTATDDYYAVRSARGTWNWEGKEPTFGEGAETRLEITRTRWNKSSKGDLSASQEFDPNSSAPLRWHFFFFFTEVCQDWTAPLPSSLLGRVCLQLNWDRKTHGETRTSKHLRYTLEGVRKPQCEGCGEKFPTGGMSPLMPVQRRRTSTNWLVGFPSGGWK